MPEISRREYLLGSMAAASLTAQTPGPRASVKRPNILWILSEDISPQLACYGEPLIQTPNLDRMAKEGARFNNAFTTAPVCSASRSALATGVFQTTTGAHNHRTFKKKPLPEGVRLMTDRLREAGYFNVLCAGEKGKKHPGGTGASGIGKDRLQLHRAASVRWQRLEPAPVRQAVLRAVIAR